MGGDHGPKDPSLPAISLRLPEDGQAVEQQPVHQGSLEPLPSPDQVASLPSMASRQYQNNWTAWDPEEPMPQPRTFWSRVKNDLFFNWFNDGDRPRVSERHHPMPVKGIWEYLFKASFPMKPETYSDPYYTPNKCPEEFWWNPWKWPQHKEVNPKIPPPLNGRYNDFLHFTAFKVFLRKEREVYVHHMMLLQEMMLRCSVKEGVNASKNCRHLNNKYFCMSRHEEFTQTLLYMSLTGNVAIRETPYPPDYVDQKRKIYDDWLTRTRMRKPGDMY